jgi:putative tryptophan/tyrosine transport system substrate-binding protein
MQSIDLKTDVPQVQVNLFEGFATEDQRLTWTRFTALLKRHPLPVNAVKLGLVASLNRPGGNVTGINLLVDEMESKRLGLLDQLVPKAAAIAVLLNPKYSGSATESADLERAARDLGRQIYFLNASSENEIDSTFTTLVQRNIGALLVGSDPFLNARREQLVGLAVHYVIPAIYNDRFTVARGGLISYGVSIREGYRQAANYVGRILKGERGPLTCR